MNKKLLVVVLVFMASVSFGLTASAETTSNTDVISVSRQKLLEKIAELQAQIKALSQKNEVLSQRLELARQLKTGAQGADVVTLQKILATDRAIYPEGLTTGFYGERTKEAIKRLQEKFGLEITGELDEKTKELINKILTSEGATRDIPPGLLAAQGLRDRVRVKFENRDGKFEYRIDIEDDNDDSDDNESELEVEVENQSNNRSKVNIDWRHDGKRFKRVISLNTQSEADIIAKVAALLGISKADVKDVIEFDGDDQDDSNSNADSGDNDDSGDDGSEHDDED